MCNNTPKQVSQFINMYVNARRKVLGILSPINPLSELLGFLYSANGGENKQVLEILKESTYYPEILSVNQEAYLCHNYKAAVEYICDPKQDDNSLCRSSYQPNELSDFIRACVNFEDGETVYNPFSGLASYALEFPNVNFVGEEVDPFTWAVSQVRLHAHGITNNIKLGDSRESVHHQQKRYKYIISTPPFGLKNYPIEQIISDLYQKLDNKGGMVLVIPSSFLVNYKGQAIREKIVNDNALKAVFLLPERLFFDTNISCALLLLQKGSENTTDVVMADASFATKNNGAYRGVKTFDKGAFDEAVKDQPENLPISRSVSLSEITAKKHFNPKAYLQDLPKNGIQLDSIVNFETNNSVTGIRSCKVITHDMLSSNVPNSNIDVASIPVKIMEPQKKGLQKIDNECVLLLINSNTVSLGLVTDIIEDLYVPRYINILTPKDGINIIYLASILLEEQVKNQLLALHIGKTLPIYNREDLGKIIIPRHSDTERANIIQKICRINRLSLGRERERLIQEYEMQIRSRKHAITQNLSSFSALWNSLKAYRANNNGVLKESDIIGRVHQMSVGEIFTILDRKLETLLVQTENLANVEYNWGKDDNIDPESFIVNYIQSHRSLSYNLCHIQHSNIADSDLVSPEGDILLKKGDAISQVYFPIRALTRVFDNIISNAISHGFSGRENQDNKILFNWYSEGTNLIVTIANNGIPISQDTEINQIFCYGYSTHLNEAGGASNTSHRHSGIGAYDAMNILKERSASIELISTPNSEYTVTYKLTFTKTNIIFSF